MALSRMLAGFAGFASLLLIAQVVAPAAGASARPMSSAPSIVPATSVASSPTAQEAVSLAVPARTLRIVASGIPKGSRAALVIRGPRGWTKTATVARTLTLSRLAPGTYRVTAKPVKRGLATYRAVVAPAAMQVSTTRGGVVNAKYSLRLTAVPASTTPKAGQALAVSGRLSLQKSRVLVAIQVRKPGTATWKTAARARTNATGAYKATVRLSSGSWQLRSRAVAAGSPRISTSALIFARGTSGRIVPGPRTKLLAASAVASATPLVGGGQEVTLSSAQSAPQVGQILASAPGPTAPEGVLGRVTAVSDRVATVKPVPLDQAYPGLRISTVVPVRNMASMSSASGDQPQGTSASKCQGEAQLTTSFQLTETHASVEIDLAKRYVSVIVKAVPKVGVATAGRFAGGLTCTVSPPRARVPLPVPGLVLGVGPQASFSFKVASPDCSAELSSSARMVAGFTKYGDEPAIRHDSAKLAHAAKADPECGEGASITVDAKMAVDLAAGGIVGVYGDAGPEIGVRVSAGSRGLCADVTGALSSGWGLKAEFLTLSWKWELVTLRAVLGNISLCGLAAAPTTVPSAPGRPTLTSGDRSLSVSWAAPSQTGGAAITGYTATATPGARTCTTTGLRKCVITGLINGTTYSVRVTARNRVGTSPPSPSASAKPAAAVATPAITVSPDVVYAWHFSACKQVTPTFPVTFALRATGFNPGSPLDVSLGRLAYMGNDGEIALDGTYEHSGFPVMAPSGQRSVFARDREGAQASAVLSVRASFCVVEAARSDDAVTLDVAGAGFLPGETVDVSFEGMPVGEAIADDVGNFAARPLLDCSVGLILTVTVWGRSSGIQASVDRPCGADEGARGIAAEAPPSNAAPASESRARIAGLLPRDPRDVLPVRGGDPSRTAVY